MKTPIGFKAGITLASMFFLSACGGGGGGGGGDGSGGTSAAVQPPANGSVAAPITAGTVPDLARVGSWPNTEYEQRNTNYVPGRVDLDKLTTRWTRQFSAPGSGPLIADNIVSGSGLTYFELNRAMVNHVYAVDERTGETRWSVDGNDKVSPGGVPVLANGKLLLTAYRSGRTSLLALDAATGVHLYEVPIQSPESIAPPLVAGDALYLQSRENSSSEYLVQKFRINDGAVQWRTSVPMNPYQRLTADSNHVYTYHGYIRSMLNKIRRDDGGLDTGAPQQIVPCNAPMGSMLGADGISYFNCRPELTAWDSIAGKAIWSVKVETFDRMALSETAVYYVVGMTLHARQRSDGALLWSLPLGLTPVYPFVSAIDLIVTDNAVIVSADSDMAVVDLATRRVVRTLPFGGDLSIAPTGLLMFSGSAMTTSTMTTLSIGAINLR